MVSKLDHNLADGLKTLYFGDDNDIIEVLTQAVDSHLQAGSVEDVQEIITRIESI